ncbi:hypothetical protein H8959_002861, partial [Pygathrix nigripes]
MGGELPVWGGHGAAVYPALGEAHFGDNLSLVQRCSLGPMPGEQPPGSAIQVCPGERSRPCHAQLGGSAPPAGCTGAGLCADEG